MATPAKEKNMSSRLLTMKFMQRASASASQSAPSTPDQRPSKRPRLSEPFLYAQPSQSAQSSVSADQQRVQEALAEEDRKRQVALDRQAADAGDTKWSLEGATESPLRGLRVVSAGYTAIDTGRSARDAIYVGEEEEETEARPRLSGRKSFGKFNKVLEKQQKDPSAKQNSSGSDDGSNSPSSDGEISDAEDRLEQLHRRPDRPEPSLAAEEARAKRKAKRKTEQQDLAQQSERRRNKQVKLNKLTSISGGGNMATGQSKGPMKCWACGGDHKQNQCPKRTLGR